ncbi:reprolysin-like metallopeptidase [Tenacibaculum geojense]|uniref:Reprolysin-like metallopeptidase n=1 Tax=Tenacibaculum geojense TaxID=915352 RepID=A0ABW3JTS0_9FLAO
MKKITFFYLCLLVSFTVSSQQVWNKTNETGKTLGISTSKFDPENSSTYNLDFNKFKLIIANSLKNGKTQGKNIQIPNEKGNLETFEIFENSVFAPSLAAKYPEIKSYIGHNKKTGAILRMSVSPKGVQTMVNYKNKPTIFMQPIEGETTKYIVYNRLSKVNLPKEDFICSTADELVESDNNLNSLSRDANDQTLRTFRIAISVNGEYTTYHGGTVEGALAAINATMTRVNAVFETDMAVRFEVQDFPQLIYLDAETDPYSESLSAWNVELQNTLSSTIGNSAYDIGHMFGASGGGGNAGCIGCVCVDDDITDNSDRNKGSGITSPANGRPEGDTFDIDYVAHEIGHQMGANHTFSHQTEGTGVNAEPGSGSTIMGYAGITSSNVQQNSDDYFHYHSIRQILTNLESKTCWQNNSPITLVNNPPIANAGNNYTIPAGTAYVLRGTATDNDSGDNLTYCWEQIDNGRVTRDIFGPTSTEGAQARSLYPSSNPDRYIPKLSRVIAGQLIESNPNSGDDWETVSEVSRDLNWALTVRDRMPTATGLGGQSSYDLMTISVDDSAGPFIVTSQSTNETWNVGATKIVTWNVAGTNSGSINAQTVNIKLSTDGGLTFPLTLASNIANNGSYDVVVPDTGSDSNQARIMVEANDNIFYAVNSSNFTIEKQDFIFSVDTPEQNICLPVNEVQYSFIYKTFNGFNSNTVFSASNLPSGSVASFNPVSASENNTPVTVTITTQNINTGNYNISLVGTSGTITNSESVFLNVYDNNFEVPTLTSPNNNSNNISLQPEFSWVNDVNAQFYEIQVATDSNFTNVIIADTSLNNQFTPSLALQNSTTYYWRIKPINDCGEGDYSAIFSFSTINCSACESSGNTSYATSTTQVTFNTINNSSAKENGAYSDFTSISTTIARESSHELSINVNTDGNYTTHTLVWIDWNQDCNFDDANESFDLGEATNVANGTTNLSNLIVTVPVDAVLGNTVMRVSTRYNSDPTSCQNGYDGEVEDYTIIVDRGASVEDFSFGNFNLYPNPSSGLMKLRFEKASNDNVNISIFDIRGREVKTEIYNDNSTIFSQELDYSSLSSGLYILQIKNGGKQTSRKIIIE